MPLLNKILLSSLLLTSLLHAATETSTTKKVLFFSKSSGWEHSVVKESPGQPSFAEKRLSELGPKYGIAFTYSKDGSLFTPEYLAQFDALMFYTSGDLLYPGKDHAPALTAAGKTALLTAIEGGKGFIGIHAASDTFHAGEIGEAPIGKPTPWRYQNLGDKADPYTRMVGAEFIVHNAQQVAKLRVVDPKFPGLASAGESIECLEEWYSLKDFTPDMHVLLVQETAGMKGQGYERPPYPSTWARQQGKGRVFYTSLGHREDVWTNPAFEQLLFGGIAWAVRNVDADITPNLAQAAPKASELPPLPPPPAKPTAAAAKMPASP